MSEHIPEEKFIPLFCNRFGIQRSNGEIVLDFAYRQQPKTKDEEEVIKVFARVALTLEAAKKFHLLLGNIIKKEPPKSSGIDDFSINR